jgi:hypothetical protein
MALPTGEDVIAREDAIPCVATRGCTESARHRCPRCERALCNRHARSEGGRRSCPRCRRTFTAPLLVQVGDFVLDTACGAVHVDPVNPNRLHYCDRERDHDDPKSHRQMHAKAGACGFACCAGVMWEECKPECDPITQLLDRISEHLDGIIADLQADAPMTRPIDKRQTSLFELAASN